MTSVNLQANSALRYCDFSYSSGKLCSEVLSLQLIFRQTLLGGTLTSVNLQANSARRHSDFSYSTVSKQYECGIIRKHFRMFTMPKPPCKLFSYISESCCTAGLGMEKYVCVYLLFSYSHATFCLSLHKSGQLHVNIQREIDR